MANDKCAYYFSHDSNLRNNINVCSMRYYYGSAGYGLYICILEMLCGSPDRRLPLNIEIEGMPHGFIQKCIDLQLFVSDGDLFWAENIRFHGSKKRFKERMYSTNVKLWYAMRKAVFERDNYTCTYCGAVGGKLEADHITPFSMGGLDITENLTTACRKCNRQKKDRTVKGFQLWREANGKTN